MFRIQEINAWLASNPTRNFGSVGVVVFVIMTVIGFQNMDQWKLVIAVSFMGFLLGICYTISMASWRMKRISMSRKAEFTNTGPFPNFYIAEPGFTTALTDVDIGGHWRRLLVTPASVVPDDDAEVQCSHCGTASYVEPDHTPDAVVHCVHCGKPISRSEEE